jgi:hypothetical protein
VYVTKIAGGAEEGARESATIVGPTRRGYIFGLVDREYVISTHIGLLAFTKILRPLGFIGIGNL